MNITTTITPKVDLANERIILEEVESTPDFWAPGGTYQRHVVHVVNLRDKATRDALICLGWRPPEESNKAPT